MTAETHSASAPWRVAVIGLGNAARTLHLPALGAIPAARIVGGVDADAGARAHARDRLGLLVFPSFEELLGTVTPDVVIVATPPDTHARFCRQALEAGAHVICEKPFASSVAEADALISTAQRCGRHIALNHEFREMPIFRALREEVRGNRVGRLVFAQAWQNMDLPPWKEPGWRGQLLQRTLFEAGVHLVDLLIALFGERPEAVSATVSGCGVQAGKSDAVALATLEFPHGRLGHVLQNRLCQGETQYFEVRAEGTEGSLRASFGGRARLWAGLHRSVRPKIRLEFGISGLAWRERGNRRTLLARNPRHPGMMATRALLAGTLRAFSQGTEAPVPAGQGRDTLAVIAACYHSAETGRRVLLSEADRPEIRELRMGAALPS